LKKKT
jgi:hypothetical protein